MTTTQALHGLVEMTNEAYHAAPGISKSHLDQMARSPRHYWHRYVNPERTAPEPSKAMVIGSATHAAVLEPEVFAAGYIAAPECDRRTKEGKATYAEFVASAEGKTVLEAADFALCVELARVVRAHPVAAGLLRAGRAEQSVFAKDPETGLLVKCRPDFAPDSGIGLIDLKTCEDASPAAFGRSAAQFRYDVQAAFYLDVHRAAFGDAPETFIFIAVEKTFPHAVGIYFVEPAQIDTGRAKARRDLERIQACAAASDWPDYGESPQPLRLPLWATVIEE